MWLNNRYDRLLQSKHEFRRVAAFMMFMSISMGVGAQWVSGLEFAALSFAWCALHSLSVSIFQDRLAAMQARLDMLRIAKGYDPE